MLTDVIFPEAGLGTFDPRAEDRRAWVFRGTLAGAALVMVLGSALFLFSYLRHSGLIADQERQFTQLNGAAGQCRRPPGADRSPRPSPGAGRRDRGVMSRGPTSGGPALTATGPTATPELEEAQRRA
jgi:type VI secretion system protein ImpL